MKTLFWHQIHLRYPEQGRLWATCLKLVRRLNPGIDILVIDNASPLDPFQFVDRIGWDFQQLRPIGEVSAPSIPKPSALPGQSMVRFAESLGHFFHGHTFGGEVRDGPGRAMTLALSMAMREGFDRAAYIEADALYRHPLSWGFDRMTAPVACQPETTYGYLDWHVWWIKDLPWFEQFRFLEKYDWANRKGEAGGEPVAENVYRDILWPHVEPLPVTGVRGETIALGAADIERHFPAGMDLITHVTIDTFARWLEINGHADLVAGLMSGPSSPWPMK